MGFRQYKAYHFIAGSTEGIEMTDVLSIRVTRVKDAKSNSAEILVNNYNKGAFIGGDFKYNTDDIVKIYATEGLVDITDGTHLLGVFFIKNHDVQSDNRSVKLVLGDNTYKLLNRVYSGDFTTLTARDIIFNIIQVADSDGLNQNNVTVSMDTLQSGGGAFPLIEYAASNKTAYDVIHELSQPEFTGDTRAYIFWFDESGVFYWIYPGQTVVGTLTYGGADMISSSFTRNEAETISSIIYNAGGNLNGGTILELYHDPSSTSTNIKYKTMLDINQAVRIIFKNLHSLADTTNATLLTAVTNDEFEAAVNILARSRAQKYISVFSRGLWEAKIDSTGMRYTMGALYTVVENINKFSPPSLRVSRIVHTMDKNGWNTQLSLSEDTDEIAA